LSGRYGFVLQSGGVVTHSCIAEHSSALSLRDSLVKSSQAQRDLVSRHNKIAANAVPLEVRFPSLGPRIMQREHQKCLPSFWIFVNEKLKPSKAVPTRYANLSIILKYCRPGWFLAGAGMFMFCCRTFSWAKELKAHIRHLSTDLSQVATITGDAMNKMKDTGDHDALEIVETYNAESWFRHEKATYPEHHVKVLGSRSGASAHKEHHWPLL